MLADIELKTHDPDLRMILDMLGSHPTHVRTGVYTDCGFNFDNHVGDDWDPYFYDDDVPSYGVADSIEQFFEVYGHKIETSERFYAVGFTEVLRSEQPSKGGWRWHKWGEYVGLRLPQFEYLHDEPEIESVVTFSVVRRKV